MGAKIPRSKYFFLTSCGQKFLTHGLMLIGVYGLNLPEVGRLLVPSVPVKLSHMDMLKSETTFNWTCIISLCQNFIPKKRQRCIRWMLFGYFSIVKKPLLTKHHLDWIENSSIGLLSWNTYCSRWILNNKSIHLAFNKLKIRPIFRREIVIHNSRSPKSLVQSKYGFLGFLNNMELNYSTEERLNVNHQQNLY